MKRFAKLLLIMVLAAPAPLVSAAPASISSFVSKKNDVQEPLIDFTHRYADVHLTMKLSKLKTLNKFLPNSLRREVGDEYWPAIRSRLTTGDSMHFKEGDISIVRFSDGKIKLTLKFPNFIMVIREVTWDQLDEIFTEYF